VAAVEREFARARAEQEYLAGRVYGFRAGARSGEGWRIGWGEGFAAGWAEGASDARARYAADAEEMAERLADLSDEVIRLRRAVGRVRQHLR